MFLIIVKLKLIQIQINKVNWISPLRRTITRKKKLQSTKLVYINTELLLQSLTHNKQAISIYDDDFFSYF